MTAPNLSVPRKLLYAAIVTFAAIALLLGGLEATLRLAHYGYSPHFARRVTLPNGEGVWRENRWVTAPYFSPTLVRRPQPFRLVEKKAPGTYRIFVLGSSAAMGDPEPSFSIGRVLETMLHANYPDVRFEVVNAAITAINSHLTRQIADDCAALEPDLFIVYEGHNEVIGPFGPSGVFTPFLRNETTVRAAVWLKGTRIGQLLSAASRSLRSSDPSAEWGGMQMFLQQQIPLTDARLDAVRDRFRENLLGIAEAAHRAGARTLMCTVLTNQRDFAPFLSQHRIGLSADDLARWESALSQAQEAERTGDLAAAEAHYRAALALDDDYAELLFRLGRLLLPAGRDREAQAFLQRALNLDTLRFRTDSSLNRVIRELRHPGLPDLEIVDLASTLATKSPHGLIGDELLYEHVHLTLRGAYDVAGELYARVAADLNRRGYSATPPAPLDYNAVRVRLGFTAYEQAMIAAELLNRFRAPPFSRQADHGFRLQTWGRRLESANALLSRPDALPALREIYQQALSRTPDDWILARNAGAMFVARQAPAEALPLLERAHAWIDDDIDTLVALGWAHRALGHSTDAHAVFMQAHALEPRYPGLPKDLQ